MGRPPAVAHVPSAVTEPPPGGGGRNPRRLHVERSVRLGRHMQVTLRVTTAQDTDRTCELWIVSVDDDVYVRALSGVRTWWHRQVAGSSAQVWCADGIVQAHFEPVPDLPCWSGSMPPMRRSTDSAGRAPSASSPHPLPAPPPCASSVRRRSAAEEGSHQTPRDPPPSSALRRSRAVLPSPGSPATTGVPPRPAPDAARRSPIVASSRSRAGRPAARAKG